VTGREAGDVGEAGEVGAGFGVAGAGEDAAFARDDGEDVAGLDEVFRARIFGGGGEDGDVDEEDDAVRDFKAEHRQDARQPP